MDGIIFDLDGTLWDSREVIAKAYNQVIADTTDLDVRVTANQLTSLFGKPIDTIFDILFPMLGEEDKKTLKLKSFEYKRAFIEKESCIFYEGMIDGMKVLAKKHKLFIVSNCQAGYIETFLREANLGAYITDYICPDDSGLLKGDNIKLIIKRNHIKSAIYVGDTQGDANACKLANIPIIYASYGFGTVDSPDYVISKFSELLDWDFASI
jgi:phosphoglycolate phosphatase